MGWPQSHYVAESALTSDPPGLGHKTLRKSPVRFLFKTVKTSAEDLRGFPMAAERACHILSYIKPQPFSQLRRLESKVSVRSVPPGCSEGPSVPWLSPGFSWLLAILAFLGLQTHLPNKVSIAVWHFPMYMCVQMAFQFFFFLLLRHVTLAGLELTM